MWYPCRTPGNVVCCTQKRFGGTVYAEIYSNAAVSDSIPADSVVPETHILALLRAALHGRVDLRTCQRDSGGTVDPGYDLGIGTAGDRDAGDCISGKPLRDPDACGEAGDAHGSDGRVCVGNCILKEHKRRWSNSAAVFDRNIHNCMVYYYG